MVTKKNQSRSYLNHLVFGIQRIVKFCRPRPTVTAAPRVPKMHCRAFEPKYFTPRELNSIWLTSIGACWRVTQPYVVKSPPVWSTVKSSKLFPGDFKAVVLSFINGVVSCAIVLIAGFEVPCTCRNCVSN